jgi:tight adherence protein C
MTATAGMILLFLIGLLLVGAAVALFVRAAALPRLRVGEQLRQIDTYGFGTSPGEAALPGRAAGPGPLEELADRVGRFTTRRIETLKPMPRNALMAAGYQTVSPDAFHGLRVLAAACLAALVFLNGVANGKPAATTGALIVLATVLGWHVPAMFVRQRGQKRLDCIDRELPELIDLLTATIEAGLGFAGSLQLVAGRFQGPLGTELQLALQEQSMGLSTERALNNMLERCDTPSMRAFVRAILQGEKLGVSIGAMMRNLATDSRKRRRAAAQDRIQKAPVKMLFPLIFMIFPSVLLVLLGPAVYQLLQGLKGA